MINIQEILKAIKPYVLGWIEGKPNYLMTPIASTLTNGAASGGQKVVIVDSTTDFIAGGRVAYILVGGSLEYNQIDTIDSGTQMTLITNIGTGGIANNIPVTMISEGEYQAAEAINHGAAIAPTLPDAMLWAAQGVYNVLAYGVTGDGSTDDTTAIQAIILAASLSRGPVYFPPGTYKTTSTLTIPAEVTLRGSGGRSEETIINYTGTGEAVHFDGTGTFGQGGAIVEGIKIHAPNGTDGIVIHNSSRNYFRDVKVTGLTRGINIYSDSAAGCVYNIFIDVWAVGVTGLYMANTNPGYVVANSFIRCEFASSVTTGKGVNIIGTSGNRAVDNTFISCDVSNQSGAGGKGYDLDYVSSLLLLGGLVENNTIGMNISSTCTAIRVIGTAEITITDASLDPSNVFLTTASNILGELRFVGTYPANSGKLNFIDIGNVATSIFINAGRIFFRDETAGVNRFMFNMLTGGLGMSNSAAGTTLGSVVKKIEIFDAAGTSLGFIPVYDSIT